MTLKQLYISALILFILTACKTQRTPSKDASMESEIPALELIQKPIEIADLYEKKLFWVQSIFPEKEKLVPTRKQAFIVFQKDGSVRIQSLCNTGRAQYKNSKFNIDISAEMTSRRACEKAELEFQFFEGLRAVNSFYQTGNKIFFRLKDQQGLMEFELIH